MNEALSLAVKGMGSVSPNPMVGAVIVKDGRIVGRGWHKKYGGPHAEVFALRQAGAQARGAVLYCTLEPCNHTGKTPPCVNAVLNAGICTVVLGMRDPNPVAAGGVNALRAAGVKVIEGILETECRQLNAPFTKRVTTGLPFVTLKWAMSADGKIAAVGGDSKWITGSDARAYAHALRASHDAVLIGIGTLLADDAQLTARKISGKPLKCQPRRIILDSQARTPLNAAIWTAEKGGPIIVVVCKNTSEKKVNALRLRGAKVLALDAVNNRLPLREALKALAGLGIQSILVEGGSEVLGSFIDHHLADRACIFVAPKIIGGRKSVTAVAGHGVEKVAKSVQIQDREIQMLGNDVLITGAISESGKSGLC